jgi:acyl carrier protein
LLQDPATIELEAMLRYTGSLRRGRGADFRPRSCAAVQLSPGNIKTPNNVSELAMSSTYDTIANIIAETCDIPRDTITPDSHAINDLGIDSLDFLDIAFAIDKAFGIKLPLEKWTQEVNDGKATTDQYFVLKNLSARIDELVAAKGA